MLRNRINSGYLMIPEGENGGGTGSGDNSGEKSPPNGKINIGGKEYEPDEAAAAISLYKALGDPETSSEIVETMARKLGLLDKQGNIKGDKDDVREKVEGRITKQLKAKLGKDYVNFADMVGGVLDEAIEQMLEEHGSRTNERLSQNTWSQGVDKFMESHIISEAVEEKMATLTKRSPPDVKAKGFDQQEYLEDMYELACKKVGETPRNKRNSSREVEDDAEPGTIKMPKIRFAERPKIDKNEDRLDRIVEDSMNGIKYKTGS